MNERSSQAQWITVMALTAVSLYLCWSMLQPFLEVIAWAVILVVLFAPAHARILAKVRRPGLAAALAVLMVLITVIVPLVFVTSTLVNELAVMAGKAQEFYQMLSNDPATQAKAQEVLAKVSRYVDVQRFLSSDNVRAAAGRASQWLVERSAGLVGGLLGTVVNIFFTIFTMFYLFRDREAIVRQLPDALPLQPADSLAILAHTRQIISASVYGVLVIALIQGVLGGVMFWILGIPSPLVWAVLMTAFCLIPMAGSAVVWVPAMIFLGLTGHYAKAVVLLVWGALVIGTADNLLRPRLVGNKTKMHELSIFFSVLGGLRLFGVLGILLGPVVLAVTLALLEVLWRAEKATPTPTAQDAPSRT